MGNKVASTMELVGLAGNSKRRLEPLSSSWKLVKSEFKDGEDILNGYFLNDVLVPETLLEIILSYTLPVNILTLTQIVASKNELIGTLIFFGKCILLMVTFKVCIAWKDITTRRTFWKLVCHRRGLGKDWDLIPEHIKERDHSWMVFYQVVKKTFLSKNLVKNPSGHDYGKVLKIIIYRDFVDQFENWVILRNGGGNNFAIESPPVGIDGLPPPRSGLHFEGLNDVAFATTYQWCSKQQKIDLWEAGLTPAVMKIMLPFQFELSEMVGSRFDCGGMYRIHICLQNYSNEDVTNEVLLEDTRHSGAGWGEVTSILTVDERIENKLNDIRYFVLTNHGKDNQFWAGHYGIKFSRITVTVKCLPPSESCEEEGSSLSAVGEDLYAGEGTSTPENQSNDAGQRQGRSCHGMPSNPYYQVGWVHEDYSQDEDDEDDEEDEEVEENQH